MNVNCDDNEMLMAIDQCVKKEFTDVNQARSVAVFLALTLLDRPLSGIDTHYSMSRQEIEECRRTVANANLKYRSMSARVKECRLAMWKMIRKRI